MKLNCLLFLFVLSTCSVIGQNKNADCSNPYKLCELGVYNFQPLSSSGQYDEDLLLGRDSELAFVVERNTMWIDWRIQKSGNFEFEIAPSHRNDDFDFILYKVADIENQILEPIRIMMSGKNLSTKKEAHNCLGKTGLRKKSLDNIEQAGCGSFDDNYLSSVNAAKGEHYILLINSFHPSSKFDFTISGDVVLNRKNCAVETRNLVENFVKVYPNPAIDQITINYKLDPSLDTKIVILDVSGKIVYNQKITLNQDEGELNINTSDFISGQYFIKVLNGEAVQELKFLKL